MRALSRFELQQRSDPLVIHPRTSRRPTRRREGTRGFPASQRSSRAPEASGDDRLLERDGAERKHPTSELEEEVEQDRVARDVLELFHAASMRGVLGGSQFQPRQ